MAYSYSAYKDQGIGTMFGTDGVSNGALYYGTKGIGGKADTDLMTSGMLWDSKATASDALSAGDISSYMEITGDTVTQEEFDTMALSHNKSSGMGDWLTAGLGLGNLALGYLGYKDQNEAHKKNMTIMDQQIASNDVTAARSKENYEGLHGGWSKPSTPIASPATPPIVASAPPKPEDQTALV